MVYFIYTKLPVYIIVLLIYSKDYVFFLRLIYIKYIIVILFFLNSFTILPCDIWSCDSNSDVTLILIPKFPNRKLN